MAVAAWATGVAQMLIDAIELRNIKSYTDEEISFRHGVNGISGANGAGKTTILESIGFALFDNLQYSQKHFLRKGAKSGDVRIHLTASDGVEYTITRSVKGDYRVGSPVGDLAVGKIDVQDWIVENLFGGAINSGDLSSIFENAVGVPQGTFTTSFLSTPTVRKKVFDSILRVDEYRTAFENLNDVSKIIKNEIDCLEKKHHELKGRTSNYDELKERFGRERNRVSNIQEDLAELAKRLEQLGLKKDDLGKKKELIDSTGKEIEKLERDIEELKKHLVTAKKQLEEALDAKKVLEETMDAKAEYLESQKKLKDMEGEKHKRNRLNEQRLKQESKIQQMEQELEQKKNLSEELEKNRKKLREIAPLVTEQQELVGEIRSIEGQARDAVSLKSKISDLERENKRFDEFSKDLGRLEKAQKEIEPLVTEQQELVERIRSIGDQIRDVVSLKSDISDLEKKRELFESLSKDLGRREKEHGEIEPLVMEQQELVERIRSIEDQIRDVVSLKSDIGDLEKKQEMFESLSKDLGRLETEQKEIEPLANRAEALEREKQDVKVKKTSVQEKVKGIRKNKRETGDTNRCPILEGVECEAVTSFSDYFEEKLSESEKELSALKYELTKIEKEIKGLGNPGKRMELNNSEISRITGQLTLLAGVADRLQQCRDMMREQDLVFSGEYVSYLANLPETAELEEKMKQTMAAMGERLKALDNPEKRIGLNNSEISRITGQLTLLAGVADRLQQCRDMMREQDLVFSGEYVSYLANLPETAELEEKMKQTMAAMGERLKALDNPEKRIGLNNSEISRITGQLTLLAGVADRLQQCRDMMREQDLVFSGEYVSYLANLPETAELEEKMKQTMAAMGERLKTLNNPEQQASNIGTLINAITEELNRIKTGDYDIKRENSRLFDIKLGLSEFSDLDSREAEVRKRLHDCEPYYMRYLQNEKNAGTVDIRRSRCDEVNFGIAEKKMENDRLSKTLAEHNRTFDEEEYERIKKEYESRKIERGGKKTEYDVISKNLKGLKKDLDCTESLIREKERLKGECGSKREFLNYTEFIRSTLKDSAQLIAGKLIKSIGDEANRIYCEIINDYTQELRWTHDYAITITEHGEEKEFNQLSGGEQMGASLAVRFALLKILSGCDVVFLDEPTQNMDETRREKLSEQILNISGFKQIFVISHDDTFNEKYENVIRVEKIDGVSRVMDIDPVS
ncbi:MAG: AAA family ATPase [Euryarchaeota archaeon]|nr:AAA family ATPase [Euryarchaeota archaeon]